MMLLVDSGHQLRPTPLRERESTWSPDGRAIIFMSNRRGHFDLFDKPSSGAGAEDLLLASDVDQYPSGFLPDGKSLLYWTQGDPKTAGHLWVLPMTGERKPYPFAQTLFRKCCSSFAPVGDGSFTYPMNRIERKSTWLPFKGQAPSGGFLPPAAPGPDGAATGRRFFTWVGTSA